MIRINKIRKGNTFQVLWPITTNGSAISLLNRDLTLYIIDPTELYKEKDFTIENVNKILFTYEGTELKLCGIYRLLLIENKNQNNQSMVDCMAFELVPKSEDEYTYNSNSIVGNTRIINLNTSNLGTVSLNEQPPVTPDTPANPNYSGGAKEVAGFKEVEVSKEPGATNIYKVTYTDGTFSTIKATNGSNGKDGISPTITIGDVVTVPEEEDAYVRNVGSDKEVILEIGLPRGKGVDPDIAAKLNRIIKILGPLYDKDDSSGASDGVIETN